MLLYTILLKRALTDIYIFWLSLLKANLSHCNFDDDNGSLYIYTYFLKSHKKQEFIII